MGDSTTDSRETWEAVVTAQLGTIKGQLADLQGKLDSVTRIPELVEKALAAIATESRNAADIRGLRHELDVLKAKVQELQPSLDS